MAATTQMRNHWAAGVAAVLVGLPVFFSVFAGGRIGPPTGPTVAERGSSIGVPLSLAFMVLAVATSTTRMRVKKGSPAVVISLGVFVAINFIALLNGALNSQLTGGSFAFFVQTMLPLLGYVYGVQLFVRPGRTVEQTYNLMFWIPLFSLLIVGLTTFLDGGRPWSELGYRFGPLGVPQILRYVPTVFAAAFVGLGHLRLRSKDPGPWALPLLALSLPLLASVHSRTTILIVLCGLGLTLVVDPKADKRGKRAMAFGWLVLGSLVLVAAFPEVSDGPVALNRFFGNDEAAQLSSERRYEALISSFTEAFTSPLGRSYSATENISLGGVESAITRISNSENQFGEFGLRAGPIAILAAVYFLVSVLRESYIAIKHSPDSRDTRFMEAVWVASTATIVASTFTQQPLTQPFPGLFIWLMLGLLRGWTKLHSKGSARRPVEASIR